MCEKCVHMCVGEEKPRAAQLDVRKRSSEVNKVKKTHEGEGLVLWNKNWSNKFATWAKNEGGEERDRWRFRSRTKERGAGNVGMEARVQLAEARSRLMSQSCRAGLLATEQSCTGIAAWRDEEMKGWLALISSRSQKMQVCSRELGFYGKVCWISYIYYHECTLLYMRESFLLSAVWLGCG